MAARASAASPATDWISAIFALMSPIARPVCCARDFTSPATTANPFPASRQQALRQLLGEDGGEFGLAAALVRQRQQTHHGPARGARIDLADQPLPGGAVGRPRKQSVTIDEVKQRHRLAAQAVDDVAIVHHLGTPAVAGWPAASQGQHPALAEKAFQPV